MEERVPRRRWIIGSSGNERRAESFGMPSRFQRGRRKPVEATVAALKRQAEGLVAAAEAIGIKRLNTNLPK